MQRLRQAVAYNKKHTRASISDKKDVGWSNHLIKRCRQKVLAEFSINGVSQQILTKFLGVLRGCTRLGDYRILCQIQNHELIVLVVSVGHRRDVYR